MQRFRHKHDAAKAFGVGNPCIAQWLVEDVSGVCEFPTGAVDLVECGTEAEDQHKHRKIDIAQLLSWDRPRCVLSSFGGASIAVQTRRSGANVPYGSVLEGMENAYGGAGASLSHVKGDLCCRRPCKPTPGEPSIISVSLMSI